MLLSNERNVTVNKSYNITLYLYPVVTEGSSPGLKWPGYAADHSPSLKSKIVELYIHCPICFYGIVFNLVQGHAYLTFTELSPFSQGISHCLNYYNIKVSALVENAPMKSNLEFLWVSSPAIQYSDRTV
jgi:hypothetical protein